MTCNMQFSRPADRRIVSGGLLLAIMLAFLGGCEVNSFLDPSKTGRFDHSPTTIPILKRLDVIDEPGDPWGQTTAPLPDDLVPSDLSYRLVPGDVVTVDIFELYTIGEWYRLTRAVDASGNIRVPVIDEVMAAGLTAQELQDSLMRRLSPDVVADPRVDVVVERSSAFRYTIFGQVQNPGMYNLNDPGLRLLDALANTGGVPRSTEKVYVIRSVPLSEQYKRTFERRDDPDAPAERPDRPDVDIEDLIQQLDDAGGGGGGAGMNPGMLSQQDPPPVDIDQLEPARITEPAEVDVQDVDPRDPRQPSPTSGFFYDQQRGEWVRIPTRGEGREAQLQIPSDTPSDELVLERIIEIDYQKLSHGDSSLNIVVRPNDRIHVAGPDVGVVYIDGEVVRPGSFNLPPVGQLTLSRLVTAAGGLGPLAIPERVDLTRMVGSDREATIRVDLAAIRNRTSPDVLLKRDDHVIIGTNFWALPLAVIRNGFRVTYGFGFLLDRNFGNDVFGAPPSSRFGG